MQATFFATDVDLLRVVQWFLEEPGMIVFEPASRPDFPNRKFINIEEVARRFKEPGRHLAAWSKATCAPASARYTQFERNTKRRFGARGRTVLHSPAVIGVRRDNYQNGCLGASHISCWNEKGARQRSMYSAEVLDQVDWSALRSIVRGLQRKLAKAAPAKLNAYPIMQDAFDELRAGRLSLWNWGAACSYPSPDITLT